MGLDMAGKYDRRNARAIQEGWTGYGQKRAAARLGYTTPSEYTRALGQARKQHRPVPAQPSAPRRTVPTPAGLVRVRDIGGGAVAVGGPWGAAAAIWREVRRFADHRRATIHIGGIQYGRRGFRIGYIKALMAEQGVTFAEWLEWLVTEGGGGTDSEMSTAAVGHPISVVIR